MKVHINHKSLVYKSLISRILSVISFAKEWLKSIGEDSAKVTAEECKFCHSESVPEDMEIEIMTNGYFIAKMEGCPE